MVSRVSYPLMKRLDASFSRVPPSDSARDEGVGPISDTIKKMGTILRMVLSLLFISRSELAAPVNDFLRTIGAAP